MDLQKITFHNNRNDLECTFATDAPNRFLAAFDGNSLGAEFVRFKPIAFDGSRTLSHTLSARTVTFTADWYAVENGKYSRTAALAEWTKMQHTFVPGDEGTLTWTNGTDVRTITCYASEVPTFREKVRWLFTADFTLTADYPLWKGDTPHTAEFSGTFQATSVEIENTCPLPVPFLVEAEGRGGAYIFGSKQGEKLELLANTSGTSTVYIDTSRQLAYKHPVKDGEISFDTEQNVNYLLSPTSSFFKLLPGTNIIVLTINTDGESETAVTFKWYDYYLGVN